MNITNRPVAHTDERGKIRDVLLSGEAPAQAASIITCAAGSARGNHYHVHSTARVLVLRGRFLATARRGEERSAEVVEAGQMVIFYPGEPHRLEALVDSEFLMLRSGLPDNVTIAEDTVREEP